MCIRDRWYLYDMMGILPERWMFTLSSRSADRFESLNVLRFFGSWYWERHIISWLLVSWDFWIFVFGFLGTWENWDSPGNGATILCDIPVYPISHAEYQYVRIKASIVLVLEFWIISFVGFGLVGILRILSSIPKGWFRTFRNFCFKVWEYDILDAFWILLLWNLD